MYEGLMKIRMIAVGSFIVRSMCDTWRFILLRTTALFATFFDTTIAQRALPWGSTRSVAYGVETMFLEVIASLNSEVVTRARRLNI